MAFSKYNKDRAEKESMIKDCVLSSGGGNREGAPPPRNL
jgi:hypothetical protein